MKHFTYACYWPIAGWVKLFNLYFGWRWGPAYFSERYDYENGLSLRVFKLKLFILGKPS